MKQGITVLAIACLFFFGFTLWNPRNEVGRFPIGRTFQISYVASVKGVPEESSQLKIWIPLASDREGQRILDRKIVAPSNVQIATESTHGNEMLYFEAGSPVPKELDFRIDYTAEVGTENFLHSSRGEKIETYLKPSRLMVVTPEVKEKAKIATEGKHSTLEIAKGIYDYVIRHMVYEKTTPGWGRGDTLRACLIGRGNCTDFHSLFISMAHAAEVPARFKIGFTVPDQGEGAIPGYHCWAEFFDGEKGWQPVDASEAWKHPERKEVYFGNFDTNKFLISMGRDVDLVPKQSGASLNIFFYPHVEVDGKEFKEVETSFQFKALKSS